MPLYEYYCPKCESKFEMLRSMDRADESTSCPQGHPSATRVLSLTARPARGDGFEGAFEAEEAAGCACGGNCSCG
ncbi:MAG TPA: zinc ribbon domain-containing protein [Dehalococcoidia bacterium]|nr:zinc ribbon domain-containing protein [Dehalococcoidia bacterium]